MSELPLEQEVVTLRQQVADLQHELKELSGYNEVVTQERDAAETRNENYRLKLHERDAQLAASEARRAELEQQLTVRDVEWLRECQTKLAASEACHAEIAKTCGWTDTQALTPHSFILQAIATMQAGMTRLSTLKDTIHLTKEES